MKILTLAGEYPSLYQTWFGNYVEAMKAKGHTVHVWAFQTNKSTKSENASVECINTRSAVLKLMTTLPWLLFTRMFYQYLYFVIKSNTSAKDKIKALTLSYLLRQSYDLIHIHSEKLAAVCLPILRFRNTPIVITFHGLQPQGVPNLPLDIRNRIYSEVSMVMVNTRHAENQFRYLVGESDAAVNVIPQGIDLERFMFRKKDINTSCVRLLTVCRLDYFKGIQFAIEAVRSLLNKGYSINYRIAGNGLYRPDLQKLIDKLNLGDHVELIGPVSGSEVLRHYATSDIFILPSIDNGMHEWTETQGICLQEAQATGLATIGTNSGGIPECIPEESGAIVVEQQSSKSIADAIEEIVRNTGELETRQAKGREWVTQEFSLDRMADRIDSSYKELLKAQA